jgi:hypothetical protein
LTIPGVIYVTIGVLLAAALALDLTGNENAGRVVLMIALVALLLFNWRWREWRPWGRSKR